MDLLLILSYAALCIAIFKIFKIPLNKWSVPTAVLGGVIIIGGLILMMNYNHPFSPIAKRVFVTTPIVPTVKGRVIDVPVEPNELLSPGDVLFTIEPTTYVAEVNRLQAAIAAAQTEDVELDTRRGLLTGVRQDEARALEDVLLEAFDLLVEDCEVESDAVIRAFQADLEELGVFRACETRTRREVHRREPCSFERRNVGSQRPRVARQVP